MDRTFVCSKAFSHRSFSRKRESSAGSPPSRGRTEFLLASLLCPHDLDVVARLERCVAPSRTGNDSAVERHRNAPLAGIDGLLRQQGLNGSGSKRFAFAVHADCLLRHRELSYSAARAGKKRSRPKGRITKSVTSSRMSRAMASAVTGASR